ncbi:MAG: phage Gp37/Gp68 family protein [Bacteroidota bacterium]
MSIQVLGEPWNPATGCTKISPGCKNCYAEAWAHRLHGMNNIRYVNGFKLTTHPPLVDLPRKIKKSQVYFVNSMSNLFHKDIPLDFIQAVFKTMNESPQHTFQILTKRSTRLKEVASEIDWPDNVWMGVSVENRKTIGRIKELKSIPAKVKFISFEPLIGDIGRVSLSGIDWVIVGGESGPGARPMEKAWLLSLLKKCRKSKSAFFFKQWGGVRKDLTGRRLNGRIYNEMPKVLLSKKND